jgi:SAM-dependent methyltransferase
MTSSEQRLSAFYELRAQEEPARDPEAQLRFAKALEAAALRRGERLLDIGAKWGGLGERARASGWDGTYTGLELNDRHIAAAAVRGLDVRSADAGRPLPVPDSSFDAVICLELLEHLPSPLALLEEISRVLAPGGRAVLSVPNPYSWVEVARELTGWPDPEGHLNGFTTPVMRNLLALAGMRLERRLGTSVRVPRTGWIVPTNSILARSRIFVARPAERVQFAGREL